MNRTTATAGLSRTMGILLTVLAFLGPLAAQEPTACIGNDVDELRAASKAAPDNIGLRMRIVRRQLDDFLKTDNQRKARTLLDEVESQLAEIKKLGPDFGYVYRVLARQHYRRARENPAELATVLEAIDQQARIGTLDFEMRSLKVRSLFQLGWNDADPQPARIEEAARYVAEWFDSPSAPIWSSTVALLSAWLIEPAFRDGLLDILENRYQGGTDDLNLALSLAGCYYALGRYESAWKVVHAAEARGLCDEITGGRHPIVEMLRMKCYEFDAAEKRYDGFDLTRLRDLVAAHPEDVSLVYRLALRLRAKGYTGEAILERIDERLAKKLEVEPDFDTKKLDEQRANLKNGVAEAYREAIPYAKKAVELNPRLDAAILLLGDLYAKNGKAELAAETLREGLARVPFFVELREKLAEVEADRGNWMAVAEQLAEVCKLAACDASNWKSEPGSLLPVPALGREKLMADMIGRPEARKALLEVFGAAADREARNPNLRSYLAMLNYYAGDRAAATRWAREAEALGLCGEAGFEHPLAVKIYSRERW